MENKWFSKMGKRFAENREMRREKKRMEAALADEIEQIAKQSKADFRMVYNYKQKLIGPAISALNYIEQNLSHIPGPVALDHTQWNPDGLLGLLFSNSENIRDVLHTNRSLKSFFEKEDKPYGVGLLTADWKQKTMMGIEMEGEVVRRDVPQQAYYFENHAIGEVCATVNQARERLRSRILGTLIVKVVMEVQGLREWNGDLRKEQEMLELFVDHPADADHAIDSLENEKRVTEAKQILADLDAKEQTLRTQIGDPESQLGQVVQVLLNPQPFFSAKSVTLHLNRLGVRVKPHADETAFDITLAQCELVNQPKKTAVWVQVNR